MTNQSCQKTMELINTYDATMSDVRIRDFVKAYDDGEMSYPLWQRFDNWSDNFKQIFIRSLLEGKDIPKIYTCEDPEDPFKSSILDGGHRSRAIVEYIRGGFAIPLNDENWYVFTQPEEGRPVRVRGRGNSTSQTILLPDVLKTRLLRTQLQVVSYSDLGEKEARKIFNELNHQRSMTIPELVNTHSSLLVDGIRQLSGEGFLIDDLVDLVPKFKKPNHEFYKFMVAMFSITERPGDDSFKYCEPASLLRYVRGDGLPDDKGRPTHDAQFTHEDMNILYYNFINSLQAFIGVLEALKPTKITETGDVYSLFQYVHQHQQSIPIDTLSSQVKGFMDRVIVYKRQEKHIEKTMNHPSASPETVRQKKVELDALRSDTGPHIVEWAATTQNNPCGPSNMRTRSRILMNHLQ